jgi:hypothetical protein
MEPDCFVGRLYFSSKVEQFSDLQQKLDFELNSATKWSSEPVIRISYIGKAYRILLS